MSKRRTELGANASGRRGKVENRRVASRHARCKALKTPGQSSLWGDEQRYARAMRQLRVCIGVLTAILVAAAARALIDGLTVGLALALALTGVLLVAALWLRRLGSRGLANVVLASAEAARNQTSNAAPGVMPSSGRSE